MIKVQTNKKSFVSIVSRKLSGGKYATIQFIQKFNLRILKKIRSLVMKDAPGMSSYNFFY